MKTSLAVASQTVPRTISQRDDGRIEVSAAVSGDVSLGARVHFELQNPANADALFTIPVNKTFTGTVVLVQTVAGGTIGLSAATGGSQASMTGVGIDPVAVTIAGGGSGNALTATVSNGGKGSVIIDGYIK